jgi:hypothetical protein
MASNEEPGKGAKRSLMRFLRRKEPPVSETEPAVPPAAPRRAGVFQALGRGAAAALAAVDGVLFWLAVPFGIQVRHPVRRYGILLGVFAVLFLLGALLPPALALAALAVGYVGVLAIGRAWVVNEKERIAIVKKLKDADPDQLPDLRWTALESALMLLVLFPLVFMQLQRQFQLYNVHGDAGFRDWLWFTLDKTYLKALPDWSILYGVHISSIEFDSIWGRHLVLLARLTVDYILIQGVLRLLAIHLTIREAVAAVKADPEMAVRVGRRAVPALLAKLNDPDKAVRGAAANALTQLGAHQALQSLLAEAPAAKGG